MLLWSLIIVTFILCAVSSFPTKWCQDLWGWAVAQWHGHRVRRLEREMDRKVRGTGFTATRNFLPQGVGLALDPVQKLLFVAERDERGMVSSILPFTALRTVSLGEANDAGFFDYYVDLAVRDRTKPRWRLLCGENFELAAEVRQALLEEGVGEVQA